jgi:hypothetical protein
VTMPLATRILSGLMVLVGLAMIVSAVARGGGPLAYGVILGILFIAVGAGRLWTERQR